MLLWTNPMRRGKPPTALDYVRVRIEWLLEERAKNTDSTAQLVLDKSIFELGEVEMLLEREAPAPEEAAKRLKPTATK